MSKAGESILQGAREALAYARGESEGFVAHVPEEIDVRAVRRRTGLSQARFAQQFGFALDALRNWEQRRRQPDLSARAFLMVIDREPEAVRRALAIPAPRPTRRTRTPAAPQPPHHERFPAEGTVPGPRAPKGS